MGIVRQYEVTDFSAYRAKKAYDKSASIRDFVTKHELRFDRLPGYENMQQKEYAKLMLEKYEDQRLRLVRDHLKNGARFKTKAELKKTKQSATAKKSKKSARGEYRPIVICKDPEARQAFLAHYFAIYENYKKACARFLAGDRNAKFPTGTYLPPCLVPVRAT